jgi:NhaA family Na+:H+ antiporter
MLKYLPETIDEFMHKESSGGITLVVAALIAIILANSPLSPFYNLIIDTKVTVAIGELYISKPALLWINDGLMAIFFFMVGLELKREIVEGELSDKKQIVFPAMGAVGGMAVPAMIYFFFTKDDPVAVQGWAIPTATDIAFALGILSLLGKRVPISLKVFLTSLAIFDDLAAILVIAFFYTSKISMTALIIAAISLIPLFILNRMKIAARSLYMLIALVMWTALLKSGVHATLAGVVVALFIPMEGRRGAGDFSPLKSLERDLHTTVAFVILPIFAFANAGLDLRSLGVDSILHPVSLGTALGLFVGKQLGVFSFCWLALKLKWAKMPEGMNFGALYGAGLLCGVGFTMSLFIGSLAFEETGVDMLFDERLGILSASILSGIAGFIVLSRVYSKKKA